MIYYYCARELSNGEIQFYSGIPGKEWVEEGDEFCAKFFRNQVKPLEIIRQEDRMKCARFIGNVEFPSSNDEPEEFKFFEE